MDSRERIESVRYNSMYQRLEKFSMLKISYHSYHIKLNSHCKFEARAVRTVRKKKAKQLARPLGKGQAAISRGFVRSNYQSIKHAVSDGSRSHWHRNETKILCEK